MLRTTRFCMPCVRQAAKRQFSACAQSRAQRRVVDEVQDRVDVATFRRMAATDGKAVVFRQQVSSNVCRESDPLLLPALGKWFANPDNGGPSGLSPYFRQYLSHTVPYELVLRPGHDAEDSAGPSLAAFTQWLRESSDPLHQALHTSLSDAINQHHHPSPHQSTTTSFMRFHAPLALLESTLHFNRTRPPLGRFAELYIAQAGLPDLPPDLQQDVPTPRLLADRTAAPDSNTPGPEPAPDMPYTADIYDSSLWLGLTPTFTPWHRDPNPNLFCQLRGAKAVRLLPPQAGRALFGAVMQRLGKPGGSAAIRGDEMMQGVERQAWFDAVWGPDAPGQIAEAVVRPGDALFIPKGWWHSVRSVDGHRGELNASVNWWFRWRSPRR